MLARHIIGYLPSLVIPALAAFGAIYCYTHVLTPAEFGYYALALNAMTLIAAFGYYWLQTSLPRLLPQAIKEGTEQKLLATTYGAYGVVSLIILAILIVYLFVKEPDQMRTVIILATCMAIVRALLSINQSLHRSKTKIKRYNIIECGQAVLGLAFGLLLAIPMGMGGTGAIIGVIVGMLLMVVIDIATVSKLSRNDFDKAALKDISHFGLPLVLTYGVATFLAVSDRFLIEHLSGAASLGIYAAGYTLMDRIIQMLFLMIAVPSFPLTINKLEREGVEAARQQTYNNGVAILLIALPACAGLILTSEHLAFLLIGPEFRAGALQVMPYIALSAILGGLSTHYFDHAFYLAKKPRMLLMTQVPAAVLNLVLNLMLIPQYGFMGAAYANVAAYALLLLLSIVIGRGVFAMSFPMLPALQIAGATILMSVVLYSITFPVSLLGFMAMVSVGGACYGGAVVAINVSDMRNKALKFLSKKA